MSYVWIEAIITTVTGSRGGHFPNQRFDFLDIVIFLLI